MHYLEIVTCERSIKFIGGIQLKKTIMFLVMIIFILVLTACSENDNSKESVKETEDPETLVLGFVPSRDASQLADNVEPLAKRLSEKLDMDVKSTVSVNINATVEAMGANQVHIGFIPAFGYVLANEQYDAEVLLKSVRNGKGYYKAQFMVRKDSGINDLKDLEDKIWVFSDRGSTSGYLFPAQHLMTELGIDSVAEMESDFFSEIIEAGSHDTAVISLLEGDADVATSFDHALDNLEADYPDIKDQIKVIEYTVEIPNDTISVSQDISDDLKQRIKEAFLSFNDEQEMIDIMNEVYTWDAIEEAEDAEYDVVKDTYHKFKNIIEEGQ